MDDVLRLLYSYSLPYCETKDRISGKPFAQPVSFKIFKAIGYVPILGTAILVVGSCGMTVAACNHKEGYQIALAFAGRATLSLVPPLLMVVDLIVTLVDFHLLNKKLRQKKLAKQQKSLRAQEQFPKKLLGKNKQMAPHDRQSAIVTLRAYVQAVVNDNHARSKIPSDNDERKWLYFLRRYVCNHHSFEALFNAVIQDPQRRELLDFILKVITPSEFNLAMKKLGNFYFKFGEKTLHVHEAIFRQLGGTYFTAINSYLSYQKVTFMDLPLDDYEGFYQGYYSTLLGKKVHLTEKNFQDYLRVADKYDFGPLKKQVGQWILDHLDSFDPKQLFELADLYGLESIKEALVEQVFSKKASLCINQIKNISAYDQKLLRSWLPRVEKLIVRSFISTSDAKVFRDYLKLCPNLKKIRLWTNSKDVLLTMKSLDKLEKVELILESNFDSEDLSCLAGLPIRTLSLARWRLSQEHFRVIGDLPLKNLNLSRSKFKRANLSNLNKITFNQLKLSKVIIKDRHIEKYIKGLSVRYLDLSDTKITHRSLELLNNMSLEELDLRKTKISQYDCSKSHFKTTRVIFNEFILTKQYPSPTLFDSYRSATDSDISRRDSEISIIDEEQVSESSIID